MNIITQDDFTLSDNRAPIHFSSHSEKEIHEGEMINSSVVGLTFSAGSGVTCQLCGRTIHHCGEDGVNLCEDCCDHVNSFSDGTMKNNIARYLIGNIL